MLDKNGVKSLVSVCLIILLCGVLLYQIWDLSKENMKFEKVFKNTHEMELKNGNYAQDLLSIKNIITSKSDNFHQITFNAMRFVHENSSHIADDEYEIYSKLNIKDSLPDIIRRLLLAYRGDERQKPHIMCGFRSYAMREILKQVNIFARLVNVYTDDFEAPAGHRLLEVLNPEGEWELWDPDHNVCYVRSTNKKPVNVLNLLYEDLDNILPKRGNVIGWNETNTKYLKDHYFEAVRFEGLYQDLPGSLILVNKDRFDVKKIFTNGMNFIEYTKTSYNNPRIVFLPIDISGEVELD